jgi:hypothetical protein
VVRLHIIIYLQFNNNIMHSVCIVISQLNFAVPSRTVEVDFKNPFYVNHNIKLERGVHGTFRVPVSSPDH